MKRANPFRPLMCKATRSVCRENGTVYGSQGETYTSSSKSAPEACKLSLAHCEWIMGDMI